MTELKAEQTTPKRRGFSWYAVVQHQGSSEGDGHPTGVTVVSAPNKTLLKKALDADQGITAVIAVFRGKQMRSQTRKVVSFVD